jgi:starch synthase
MDLVLVASEIAPWSKTGGLGDVSGALPRALARRGHRVLAVSPRYKAADGEADTGTRARFHLFGSDHDVRITALEKDGVTWAFVDNPAFRRQGIYGTSEGAYPDNLFRYALLTRAAIEAAARVPVAGRPLGEDVVFHANDWHTSLLPTYLDAIYRPAGRFTRASSVLAIHNAGHHGSVPASDFSGLDLAPRWWPTLDMDGRVNPLKAGIVSADALVTVSPTYARELMQDKGFGLEGLFQMRRTDMIGILNGVDDAWDPRTDKHLAARFSADDLSGKATCKAALQKEMGLPVRANVPILGLVARLDHQKGIDLVAEVAPWLLAHDVQLVALGSGSERWATWLRDAERRWPGRVKARIGFDEPLAHRIEAGADLFLMPSRFEPCGLNQMYSLKYGTVPVVHATGGLADTVETYDPQRETGNGWAFRPFSADAFQRALTYALLTWKRFPQAWKGLQRRGMTTDFSWDRSASLYEKVYAHVRGRRMAA